MSEQIESRWVDAECATFREEQLLLYRSQRLGSDLRITNFGGGNTSAKVAMSDPLTGAPVEVLWVKGSGGDIGTAGPDGYAMLYLDKVVALEKGYRGKEHEDAIGIVGERATQSAKRRVGRARVARAVGASGRRDIDDLGPAEAVTR